MIDHNVSERTIQLKWDDLKKLLVAKGIMSQEANIENMTLIKPRSIKLTLRR